MSRLHVPQDFHAGSSNNHLRFRNFVCKRREFPITVAQGIEDGQHKAQMDLWLFGQSSPRRSEDGEESRRAGDARSEANLSHVQSSFEGGSSKPHLPRLLCVSPPRPLKLFIEINDEWLKVTISCQQLPQLLRCCCYYWICCRKQFTNCFARQQFLFDFLQLFSLCIAWWLKFLLDFYFAFAFEVFTNHRNA